ncbi:hypothetical protein E1B28_011284 [Marasmius oreades]|uniref:SHSP domain-containing protein n=1 Tax=Marasmius oreades TaxID=181124 RepID=A0A9P7RUD4_9AGAR|nr:uncharacterized protein E1B28_011284 [Marasmius oreades]KAG7089618.1 hypothetical protein E1B28_011284 [Marasmius oreades]
MKRILVMSYPYNHGQYQDDFSTPSTPQYPQWEVLEPQQHQDPQQLEADLLTPTSQHQANTPQQLYHTPAHLGASEHFTTAQPSPVEAPPALLHRHSHEAPEASTSTWQRTSAHPSSSQALSGHAPLRRSPTARSKNRTNPYPRPQSTGQISAGPALTRVHRVGERESSGVRFAAPPISTSVSSESSSTAPTNAPGPIVSFGSTASGMSPYTPTIMLPPNTPTFPTTNTSGVQPLQRQRLHDQVPARGQEALLRPRRYIIRSDIQYDPRTHVLTASMELPGVNKSQLTITLSTCLINRIKQVIVLAHASPVFPPSLAIGGAAAGSSSAGGAMDGSRATAGSGDAGGGNEGTSHYQVRERRYGEFSRTFVVPAETELEDIDAAMADGLLTLKIACGPPAESANVQVVPIR